MLNIKRMKNFHWRQITNHTSFYATQNPPGDPGLQASPVQIIKYGFYIHRQSTT